jgi:hypothetical protein
VVGVKKAVRAMIKHRQNKPQELTRGDGKGRADREASMLAARREAESKPSVFLEERDTRREKRKAAVADAKAGRDWLPISKIIRNVVKKEGAEFDDDRRSKIEKTICNDIVLHFSDEGSGIEQSEIFMLLSKDYDKTELTPLQLAQALKTGFDRIYGYEEKREAIAKFMKDHCWMKRAVADQWLGSGDKAQSQDRSDYYELPAEEPSGGREAAKAHHALKQKHGTNVPKRSMQWLATNLPGNHSRDSVARALGKKK